MRRAYWVSAALIAVFGFAACKEKAADDSGKKGAEKGAVVAKPEAGAVEKGEEEGALEEERIGAGKGPVEVPAEAVTPKAESESAEGSVPEGSPSEAQEAVAAMAGSAPAGAPVGSGSLPEIYQPDYERLMKVFVELYCAKERGASDEELYQMYRKLDYPPLDKWEPAFRQASSLYSWCEEAMNRVRQKCAPPEPALVPAVAKDAAVPVGGGGAPEAKDAAVPSGDGAVPAAAVVGEGGAAPSGGVEDGASPGAGGSGDGAR